MLSALALIMAAGAGPAITTAPLQQQPVAVTAAMTSRPDLAALLASGYDIIHVDAPVGSLTARFILRKDAVIYSCEPKIYRSGGSAQIQVISEPCLNLTPAK